MRGLYHKYVKTIDRYIMGKYLGTFVFTLAMFVLITVMFDISERLDNFLKGKAPLHDIIFQYYAGFVPFYLNMLFPLINFLAVIYFTAKMSNQTEIVPILSGKGSFNRFLRPYFLSATIIFVVALLANVFLIPYTNQLKNTFENTYFKDYDPNKTEVHIQLDTPKHRQTFAYLYQYDEVTHLGYNFVLEKFDGDQMLEKLTAPVVRFDSVKHTWSMQTYTVRYINGLNEGLRTGFNKDTILDMYPTDFVVRDNEYSAISTAKLHKDITKEKIRGTGLLIDMQYEEYKRFIYPLSTYVLTLIGVSISSRKVRGGIGLPLGIGIFLCFAYIVVDKFAFVFSIKGHVPPYLTVLMSNVLFGALGFYLLKKAPK